MDDIEQYLIRDKFSSLQQVCEILQEEISSLSKNFFLLNCEPVVRFRRVENRYVFNVEIDANRIKPFGNKFL